MVSAESTAESDSAKEAAQLPLGTVVLQTPNKLATVRIKAVPVPARVTEFLNGEATTIRAVLEERDRTSAEGEVGTVGDAFLEKLDATVKEAIAEGEVSDKEFWSGVVDR